MGNIPVKLFLTWTSGSGDVIKRKFMAGHHTHHNSSPVPKSHTSLYPRYEVHRGYIVFAFSVIMFVCLFVCL